MKLASTLKKIGTVTINILESVAASAEKSANNARETKLSYKSMSTKELLVIATDDSLWSGKASHKRGFARAELISRGLTDADINIFQDENSKK